MIKKLFTPPIIAACALCALCGCGTDGNGRQARDEAARNFSVCYAFTASADVMPLTDTTSVKDYMDALKESGFIDFDGTDGQYGFFLTSVLGLESRTVSSTASRYAGYEWNVYSTLTQYDGVIYATDESVFVYDGVTLYRAAYGVSGMLCAEGYTYALVYEYVEMSR